MTERDQLAEARSVADRLFNACIVLYGAAMELEFGPHEAEDAELHRRVLARAENDMGPEVLARVNEAIQDRIASAT